MPMPSTSSPSGDFYDGFDEFFSDDEEYPLTRPRGESTLPGGDSAASEDEALPELDLSSFNLSPGDDIVDDDDDDAPYYEDDSYESAEEEIEWDEGEALAWDEGEDGYGDEELPPYNEDSTPEAETWQDADGEEDKPSDGYSDDELDALLNFDDASWMNEDVDEGGEAPYTLEDDDDAEDELISMEDDDEPSIDLRKPMESEVDDDDAWDEDSQGMWHENSEEDDAPTPLEEDEEDGEDSLEQEDSESSKPKKKGGGSTPWKSKLAEFKRKAQAELQGKDSKDEVPPREEMREDDNEDGDDELSRGENDSEEDEEGATRAPHSEGSGGLKNLAIVRLITRLLRTGPLQFLGKILRPIKSAYLFVVNSILKALEWVLGLLGRIPVVGKPFRWLRDLTQVLRYIATCIPLVLLIILVVHLNRSAVPHQADSTMPDSGHVSISAMSYDGNSKAAKGTLVNDGDIIIKVQPTFTVYSSSPLNPISWAFPGKQVECKGPMVKLEAGESKAVQAKCSGEAGGLFKKTTAQLDAE